MRRFLPIILGFAFSLTLLILPQEVFAQGPPAAPAPVQQSQGPQVANSVWVVDPETTFVGKNAARAGNLLNWTLQNYNWVCVNRIGDRQCDNDNNPIAKFWSQIVIFIVVPMLLIVILATAVVIIITRGRSLTIMRFIPRFVVVILLIVFSYSILQFLYQFTDLIQGFFLRTDLAKNCPPACISNADLLYVGWKYETFVGLRLLGDLNAESAFISLLLTKLTSLTYFVMVGILLMRKIILWFFIIVSPVFPLLLLYYPTRNTGKIWIGEFFRWLLYAPLFAIFLQGLVSLWRSKVPLVFTNPDIGVAGKIVYPTAVNILLGGPQQLVSPNNSVNLTETFALYVVALIMLWVVILLPWILLQIFLDYASNFSPSDSAVMKTLVGMSANKPVSGSPSPSSSPQGGGAALNLPFSKKFNIPVSLNADYKPAGMAKQLPQSNAQVLSMAKLSAVPSMRDIAKYETAMLSNDQSAQSQMSQVKDTLSKIANPVAATSTVEREHYQDLSQKLSQQSQQGNIIASNILSAAKVMSKKSNSSSNKEVKSVLQQIANPALTTNLMDRSKFTKLHEALEKESKENNNTLATSILATSDKTSSSEVAKLQEKISQQSNNSTISSVNTAVESTQIKSVLKQISNPASATGADRQKVTELRNTLTKASQQGNELATSLLKVTISTSSVDIEKLQEKIQKEKEKGVSFAKDITSLATAQSATTLPAMNRVQTVKQEDYMAVKTMWKENYTKMDVPQGMAGTRATWVKDDIAKIEAIIALLSAPDTEKVSQGMEQVSDILPFLLVGGFSQTEIVGYLQAKLDAAKEVYQEVSKDEEDKVSISAKQTAQNQQTMAATIEDSGDNADAAESPLAGGSADASTDVLSMAKLSVPKMRDIARYETLFLSQDQSKRAEVKQIHDVLQQIANPALVAAGPDREHYETLRNQLLAESAKGNTTAKLLLSAAQNASRTKTADIAKTLQAVANPTLATTEEDRKRYEALHTSLTQESQKGNELATSILALPQTASPAEVEALSAKLKDAKQKGETVASSILATSEESDDLPQANALQQVAHEEYDEVKKVWEENYRTLPVPSPFSDTPKGRIDWIQGDIVVIQDVASLLNAGDIQKRKDGLQKVSGILPFLLLGGFSTQEMVEYLTTKLTAAKTVLAELQKDEASKVTVDATPAQAENQKTMAATDEKEE